MSEPRQIESQSYPVEPLVESFFNDGKSIQSLADEEATQEWSHQSYYLFSKVAGCVGTGFSMGMSVEDYHKIYPFHGFDLSSSGESFNTLFTGASRVGYYRLMTKFSKPLPCHLTAIYFIEYEGQISVSKDGKLTRSYSI